MRRQVVAEMRALDPKVVPQADLIHPYIQLGQVDLAYQILFAEVGRGAKTWLKKWDVSIAWTAEGAAFREDVLAALFVRGDPDRPDADGDGTPDLTIDSVQDLATLLPNRLQTLFSDSARQVAPPVVEAGHSFGTNADGDFSELAFRLHWSHLFDARDFGIDPAVLSPEHAQ